jgi:predicted DNA-binding ribbon-helix-helix protein
MAKDLKRSLTLQGHRTSLSLEPEFWLALQDEAKKQGLSVTQLVQNIDADRGPRNLSSAIRVFLLKQIQAAQNTSLR